jgi:hypothetical protein
MAFNKAIYIVNFQFQGFNLQRLCRLRPTVSRPVCPGVRHPSGTRNQFSFLFEISFRQLRLCYFVAPSPTRGQVYNYCTVASGPCQSSHSWAEVPQDSQPYFTVSSKTPRTWRARFPYLYPPGTGCPSYTPGHWVPFLSPLTTRRDYGGGILTRLHTGHCIEHVEIYVC